MVNLLRRDSKKSDAQRLLGPRKKGLFGKKGKTVRSDDAEDRKKGRLFGSSHAHAELDAALDYVAPTPPVTPDGASVVSGNVNVVTVPHSEQYSQHDDEFTLYSDLTENRTYTPVVKSSVANTADPPGDMTRSSSNTDPVSAMKETIHARERQKEPEAQKAEADGVGCFAPRTATTSSETFVSRIFKVVDGACSSSEVTSNSSDIHKVLSFSPEWGVAPTKDEEETTFGMDGTSVLDVSKSPTPPMSHASKAASQKAYTEFKATVDTRTPTKKRPQAVHHDNFELVLEDIALEAKYARQETKYAYKYPSSTNRRSWMFGRKKDSNDDARSLEDGEPSQGFLRKIRKSRTQGDEEDFAEEEKKEDDYDISAMRRNEDKDEKPRAISEVNVPGSRKINMEARYKQILESFKSTKMAKLSSNRSKLSTVQEGKASEYTEMKVRVPGIQNPDGLLPVDSLIGNECNASITEANDKVALQSNLQKKQPETSLDKHELWTKEIKKMKWKEEVRKLAEEPMPLQKSRSWKERLNERLGVKRIETTPSDEDSQEAASGRRASLSSVESLTRQRSAPMDVMKKSFSGVLKKKEKPTWKSAVDSKTGRTYYYHRLTRQTTWSKPPDFDGLKAAKTEGNSSKTPVKTAETKKLEAVTVDGTKIVLRKQKLRDFDPVVWEKKEEIARLLTTMSPPDGTSVERLMQQYEGNEDELLQQLREIVQSQPFDEPLDKNEAPDMTTISGGDKKIPDSPGRSSVSSLKGRTRTGTSFMSGFSGFSGNTGTTKVSEQTEPIRNTASDKIGMIPENGRLNSEDANRMTPGTAKYIRPPSTVPVPRARELHVEEFAGDRVKSETFDVHENARNARRARLAQLPPKPPLKPSSPAILNNTNNIKNGYESAPYLGDTDDTDQDTKDDTVSVPTDSISALSETDVEFEERRDEFELARRKALDDAIAAEDWELAQALSERMRTGKGKKRREVKPSKEWTQSELDKFISDNDWDAVANYIAKVRSNAKTTKPSTPRKNEASLPARSSDKKRSPNSYMSGSVSSASNPQKRFGARSQLQHRDLSVSSWESDGDSRSSYFSDDGSEGSSFYSDEDPLYVAANNKRRTTKEFAC